jgi:hypothetical protein
VLRVYLAALGFAGRAALPVLSEHVADDSDMLLRIVQTLRLVGDKEAKKLAKQLVEDLDGDGDVESMIRDAVDELNEGGDDAE